MKKYRFIEDPGHGWLEVPVQEVVESGAKISPYSYMDRNTGMAYLEEDADCFAFLTSAKLIEEVDGKWKNLYEEERVYQEEAFVRYLNGYYL